MAWNDPDLRTQIVFSGFRPGKFIKKFRFINTGEQTHGKYKYMYAGRFVTTEVPDISLADIMKNMAYFLFLTNIFNMNRSYDYNSYKVSDLLYGNIHLNTILLILNKLFSNSNFNSDDIDSFVAPDNATLTDFITNMMTQSNAAGAHEVKQPDKFLELINIFSNITMRPDSPETLSAFKINTVPDEYFADLENRPIYKYLKNTVNEENIITYLTKLDNWVKQGESI